MKRLWVLTICSLSLAGVAQAKYSHDTSEEAVPQRQSYENSQKSYLHGDTNQKLLEAISACKIPSSKTSADSSLASSLSSSLPSTTRAAY